MSNPATNPQHEPTMEEILASIRKIISDDQPEPEKPAAQPILRAVPAEPAPAPAVVAETDVLELTEELPEEAPASVAPAATAENDIAFETIEPPSIAEAPADADTDDLISDSTRTAVGRAFDAIDKSPMAFAPSSAGSIEAIFVQAVQGAFQPTLKDWVEDNRPEIMDAMKPLIRAWMDEHLPPLIEAAVAKEIGRAASERGSRKR